MAATDSNRDTRSELTEDVFQSVVAQNGGGSLRMTIPSEIVDDLGIEEGDRLVYYGNQGDNEFSVGKVADVLSD